MPKPLFPDDVKPATDTINLHKPVTLDLPATAGASRNAPAVISTSLRLNDDYIDKLGTDSSKRLPALTSTLAEKAKASDMHGFSIKIGELISTAKGWDPSNAESKGLVTRFKSMFVKAREDVKDHYRTVEDRINDLMAELTAIADNQRQTFVDLQNMVVEAGQQAEQLQREIADARIRLEEAREHIQALQQNAGSSPGSHQELQAAMRLEKRLDRKVRDLDAAVTLLIQSGVMMQAMSDTAIGIVDKFHTVDTISISVWRNQFTLFMLSAAQKKAAEVFDGVDKATNTAAQQNASRIRQTALQVEQSNNRGVVTRETIQFVTDEMVGMLNDLKQETDSARVRRQEDMVAFEQNRQTLHAALKGSTSK